MQLKSHNMRLSSEFLKNFVVFIYVICLNLLNFTPMIDTCVLKYILLHNGAVENFHGKSHFTF